MRSKIWQRLRDALVADGFDDATCDRIMHALEAEVQWFEAEHNGWTVTRTDLRQKIEALTEHAKFLEQLLNDEGGRDE